MKLIWYLPTWGQELIVEELQPFLFGKFDLGHPVRYLRSRYSHFSHEAMTFLGL